MCSGERFENQPIFGSCSGALVATDIVLTAGHCVSGANACRDYSVTFGWDSEKAKTGILSKTDIYRCTKILKIKDDPYNGYDYALVKLDRKVKVDTSQSSSGSPLIDGDGNIVGVLSMGTLDYYDVNYAGGTCRRLRVCKGNECTGQIYDSLKDLGQNF